MKTEYIHRNSTKHKSEHKLNHTNPLNASGSSPINFSGLNNELNDSPLQGTEHEYVNNPSSLLWLRIAVILTNSVSFHTHSPITGSHTSTRSDFLHDVDNHVPSSKYAMCM